MAEPLLDIDIRRKTAGPGVVLEDVRARIFPGELIALVGASGCGKSTLLRLVAGLDRADDGRILLAGQPVLGLSRDVGFIFQQPRLFPWLTVAENVAFDLGRSLRSQPGRLAAEVAVPLPRPRQRDSAALAERRAAVLHALQTVHAI